MSVTAVAMDVAGEHSNHQVQQLAPNMCITPAAPSPLPMPYPVTGTTSSLDPGCRNTKVEGKSAMNTDSKVAAVHGNEAGTQKDVVTMTTGGKAVAVMGAPVVMFEDAMVVITGSPGFTNVQ